MKNVMYLTIAALSLSLIAQSCINNSNVIEDDMSEKTKKTITVLGYGFEKGADSRGTEMFARQMAIGSLGEQMKGARFELTTSDDRIEFSSRADASIPGMREYAKRVERVDGKYYAFFVLGAETDIEFPRSYGVYTKSYDERGESATAMIGELKMRALRECASDRFRGKMPKRLSGRLFITGLSISPEDGGRTAHIKAEFSVVFDSVLR